MLFGSKAPLWRYILGIVALSVVAQRIGVAVIVQLGEGAPAMSAAYGVQAFGGLVAAVGLFAVSDRTLYAGLGIAGLGMLATLTAGATAPAMGFSIVGFLVVVAAAIALFRRAGQEDERPRSEVNRHALTAEEAENFALRKLGLFGGHAPDDVHVSCKASGGWQVELLGKLHDVEPMTEMEWQSWLKAHA